MNKIEELLNLIRTGKITEVLNKLQTYINVDSDLYASFQDLKEDWSKIQSLNGLEKWEKISEFGTSAVSLISRLQINVDEVPTLPVPKILQREEINYLSNIIPTAFNRNAFSGLTLRTLDARYSYSNNEPAGASFNDALPEYLLNLSGKKKIVPLLMALDAELDDFELKKTINRLNLSYNFQNDNLKTVTFSEIGLQRIVNSGAFLDAEKLLKEFSRIKRCVCKIEVPLDLGKSAFGTGFLIGPNKVLTNYHVVEYAIKNTAFQSKIRVVFDYEQQADELIIFKGNTYNVSKVIASSTYSDLDTSPPPTDDKFFDSNYPPDCLDYAVLELVDSIGDMGFGIDAKNSTGKRGFINMKIPDNPQNFKEGSIFIFQHPNGNPQVLALGTNGVIGVSKDDRRIRYKVNTQEGSSGSPVFNFDYELIALHNSGDVRYNDPQFNQGVVIDNIVSDLQAKGIL